LKDKKPDLGRIDMATFDALMEQGDPGALQDEGRARDMKLSDPRKLYDLWERQHWQVQDLDFSRDKEDWAALSEERKDQVVWLLSSFSSERSG